MKKTVTLMVVILLCLNLGLSRPALAADGEEVGLWIGGGFISLLYTPIKAAFFLIMGIAGGLSMFVTVPMDKVDVSANLIKWGLYGDWLIRPDHLRGESAPQFVGTDEEFHFISEEELRMKPMDFSEFDFNESS